MCNLSKKIKINLFIIIVLLISIGLTYAYFAVVTNGSAKAKVSVTTGTIDKLIYVPGKNLNITLSQQNFYNGSGNISSETTTYAKLTAGSGTTAIHTYNAF